MALVVCAKCGVRLKPSQNGVTAMQCLGDGKSYKLWFADLYQCSGGGTEILAGFAQEAVWEHYQSAEPGYPVQFKWR